MESQNPQPDAEPDGNRDDSTESDSTEDQSGSQPDPLPLSRRAALASVAGFLGLSTLSGSAEASHGGQHWRTDIDAQGNTLFNLGALEMIDNPTFGTTDNTALTGVVNAERFLRVAPTATDEAPNVVVGHGDNAVTEDVIGATISGGGIAQNPNKPGNPNSVGGNYGTVGGGFANTADGNVATVAGGSGNEAGGTFAYIGGGTSNEATEDQTTVGGGNGNVVSEVAATISGGSKNVIDAGSDIAGFATIAGGRENVASGPSSTIGGGLGNQVHARFATIAGGGPFDPLLEGANNVVYDNYGAIGGGGGNQAGTDDDDLRSAEFATVAGGDRNTASGKGATSGGGRRNLVAGNHGTIGGGLRNEALDILSTIGGGRGNTAEGEESTVAGGSANSAADEFAAIGGGEGNTADGRSATVGGGKTNEAKGDFATIGGGAPSDLGDNDGTKNVVYDEYGTIGGGGGNQAGSATDDVREGFATVAGGKDNTASGWRATVGGGFGNTASGKEATVAGGQENAVDGFMAAIGGGEKNTAAGRWSTIGGGDNNQAGTDDDDPWVGAFATVGGGERNTATGRAATVPGGTAGKAVNDFSFVWNDGSTYHDTDGDDIVDGLSSAKNVGGFSAPPTGEDTFHVSATGGIRFITGSSHRPNVTYIPGDSAGWTTASTRSVKTNIDPVDPQAVLAGVEEMEVATWQYKDGDGSGQGIKHIGPMAEDFHDAVEVGDSDEHINSINADGVAFAAIQGLSKKLDAENTQLRDELDEKDDRIHDLERENKQLRKRLAGVEDRLADLETSGPCPTSVED